ncbi:sensor histidine kinase [Salinispira pacifica]|uniref:histidine kinase n=1 Tax=Salinispira pacifica TaxID=1307761 RepID=V5WK62_9SPIO|nr:ATP-binding protein [Salinispira pacifica]AHC16207.1 hypothetical protein L21SP2_2859 [Salinispira pacifica]
MKLRRQNLNFQIVLVITLLVLGSFVILGSVLSVLFRSSILEREYRYLELLVETYARHLEQQVDKTRSIVNAYSFENSLRTAILQDDPRQSLYMLALAREASAYLEDIVLINPRGIVEASGSLRMEGETMRQYLSFRRSLESGKPVMDTRAVTSRAGAPSIGIAAPVIHENETIAVLMGIFNIERFAIDFLSFRLPDEDMQIYVIDESYRYIIHSDPDLRMKTRIEVLSGLGIIRDPLENFQGDTAAGSERYRPPGSVTDQEIFPYRMGGSRVVQIDDALHVNVQTGILPWYMGITVDSYELHRPIRNINLTTIAAGIIFSLILSIALYLYLSRRLIRPLLSLRDRVADFEENMETIRPVFSSTNELSELELRLAHMSTTIREKNERIQTMYEQLLQSEKLASLGGLVGGLSHEMNTPLGNAVTMISNLKQEFSEIQRQVDSAALTRSGLEDFLSYGSDAVNHSFINLRRATDLVKNLKQLAVDQGSMRRREFNLFEVVQGVVSSMGFQLKRKRVEVILNIDRDIVLDSYPGPLEQVFTNLIGNTLRHGIPGDGPGRITISGQEWEEGTIRIYYRDNGQGISTEVRTSIFEPYISTKMDDGGSGLGMFLVLNIIQAVFGGEIVLEDTGPAGAGFRISFPRTPPEGRRDVFPVIPSG